MRKLFASLGVVLVTAVAFGLSSVGSASAMANLDACPTLSQGYKGGCVSTLQDDLNFGNNAGLVVDGIFGPATRQAVVAFQQSHSLTTDGIVGPLTKHALMMANSVPTPRPGEPLPQQKPEVTIDNDSWCLASTASHCPPRPESEIHKDIEPGTIRDGFELWKSGAENSGTKFPMPGRLVEIPWL